MTRKATISILDDHDGSPADETLVLVFEGVEYTTDLSAANAVSFRSVLRPWLDAAWQKKRLRRSRRKAVSKVPDDKVQQPSNGQAPEDKGPSAQEIRAWAEKNGVAVSPHGRMPAGVRAAYLRSQEKV